MQNQEIRDLSEKVFAGVASEEEILMYNRLCNYYNTAEEGWDENLYGNKNELEEELKKKIWKRIDLERPMVKMRWFKWVAAASVIFIVYSISIFITKYGANNQSEAVNLPSDKALQNDIAPGQNGAILTLASGQTIQLDSSVNGSLGRQGNVSIIKNNGELVYNNQGKTSDIFYNTITTPIGRQFNLVLADGSRVWLNAASSITFPAAFTGKERIVNITGEVFFEVAKYKEMPFQVKVNDLIVEVLGTHFNINSYSDEASIRTTLLQGAVKVIRGTESTILSPGQQAQVSDKIKIIDRVDLDEVVAWKNEMFNFNSADIKTIMRQISRWYDLDIIYQENISKETFSGMVGRNNKVSKVLMIMEEAGIRFRIEGKKLIVVDQ